MQHYELEFTYDIFQVPVIAVFTKLDQFKLDVMHKLEDKGLDEETDLNEEVERIFREHYQACLGESQLFVRLGSEEFAYGLSCAVLIPVFQECKDLAKNVLLLSK
jgi:hypothetical protein